MTRLRIVENENPDYPTIEQIENYYFDIYDTRELLGWPDESAITRLLRNGKVFGVKHKKKWYVRPDQISVLRDLVPHCRPNNAKEPQGAKVLNLFGRVRRWCTSVLRH